VSGVCLHNRTQKVMVLERYVQPGFVTQYVYSVACVWNIVHMMLFNCRSMCFQEMTIPGNALPKFFSVHWDKSPPATPTTPSVRCMLISPLSACVVECDVNSLIVVVEGVPSGPSVQNARVSIN